VTGVQTCALPICRRRGSTYAAAPGPRAHNGAPRQISKYRQTASILTRRRGEEAEKRQKKPRGRIGALVRVARGGSGERRGVRASHGLAGWRLPHQGMCGGARDELL